MKARSASLWIVVAALLNGGASCEDSKDPVDAAIDDGDGTQCGDVPKFHVGMTAIGKNDRVMAEIMDAKPIRKFENDWVVKLTDLDGELIEGLKLDRVQPYMPVHNHDGGFDPTIEATKDAGTFDVTHINLWMKDQWEVRFFVDTGDETDEIIFDVCVPP